MQSAMSALSQATLPVKTSDNEMGKALAGFAPRHIGPAFMVVVSGIAGGSVNLRTDRHRSPLSGASYLETKDASCDISVRELSV